MKRIKNILLGIIFIILLGASINVKAEEFRYYLSNSSQNYEYVDKNNAKTTNVKRGDTVLVTAILDNIDNVTNHQIASGKLILRWDDKFLSLQEVNGNYYNDSISDVTGLSLATVKKDSNKLTISDISSTGTLKAGKNKLVEFKFLVLNSASASETKIYQMDGEDLKCYNVQEERTVSCGESLYTELKYSVTKSTVNKLSMIKIDGQELEFFDEDKNDYDIEVDNDVEKIKIEVTKKDSKSVAAGDLGEKKLSYGINKFTIYVVSESGVKNNYYINVTREDVRSNDNSLSTLTLSEGEIDFSPETLEYTINVTNDIEEITITSSLNDAKAKYVTDYRNKDVKLNEGSNKIEIKVLSEKGEEKTYTLNINRALSSNNNLKLLKVNDEKIELRENEFIYYHSVENDVDNVTITAQATDPRATVKLDGTYDLVVGENEINIKVKAASGEEISYILNITRKKLLSKDSLLSTLKVEGYTLDFNQNTTLYTLKIKDSDNELKITATPENENATVAIEGNKNLENGSIIKINVKAEDGTYTRYFINIEKGSSGISPVIIIILILLLILAVIFGIIIYRKKKKEQAEFEKIEEEAKIEEEQKEELPPVENNIVVDNNDKKVLETEYDKEKDV